MRWAEERSQDLDVGLRVMFRGGRGSVEVRTSAKRMVEIETSNPAFFTHLVSAPTPAHFEISDVELFCAFFSARRQPPGRVDAMLVTRRDRLFRWYISRSTVPAPPHLYIYPHDHFTTTLPKSTRIWLVWVLWFHAFGVKAEEWVMYAISAKFVEGAEPWKIWERALRRLYKQETIDDLEGWEDLGSVQYT